MDTMNNFTTTELKVNFHYPNSAWLPFIKHIPRGVSPDLPSGFTWYLWIYLHMQFALHKTDMKTAEKAKLISVGQMSQLNAASGSTPGCSSSLETGNGTACLIFIIKCNSPSVEYFCCLHTSTIKMEDTTFLCYSHDWGSLAKSASSK